MTTLMSCSISSIGRCPARRGCASSRSLSSPTFARVEAGRRLVEAQQHRAGAHGARDLQPALRAIGQRAGRLVGTATRPSASSQSRASSTAAALGPGVAGRGRAARAEARGRASACCAGPRSGSPARSCRRTGGCSGRCAPPGPAAIRWPGMRSSAACRRPRGERAAAGGRPVEPGHAVEHRRLAGAVRADDRGDLAGAGGEATGRRPRSGRRSAW